MILNDLSFLILILVANVLINGSFWPVIGIIAALIHELGHLIAIKLMGSNVRMVRFVGLGFCILPKKTLSYKQTVIIHLAGPCVNFSLSLVLWIAWLVYSSNPIAQLIAINLLYGGINLLPIPPLDGYNAFFEYIYSKTSLEAADKIHRILLCFSLFLIALISVLLLVNKMLNVSLILILIFLTISVLRQIQLKT